MQRVAISIGLLFYIAALYVHQPPSRCPTPLSRLDLLHAIAGGRVSIDQYAGNTTDKAEFQGHLYSDKAPGTVVLAAPAFLASVLVLNAAKVSLDSDFGWLVSSWMACVGSVAIVAALGAACLYLWLCKYVPKRFSLATTLAIFLGAAPLPYATMMFSHSLVIGCIAIALWAIDRQDECKSSVSAGRIKDWSYANRYDLLAGLMCGWALASEYTSGIVVVGVFVWALSKRWQSIVPFCLAAIPPLLLIPTYSLICFRNPFILPYSLDVSFPEMKHGLYAIRWPSLETAYELLLGPTRGLIFWTPVLAVAALGWCHIRGRSLFWLTYVLPVLQILIISGRHWDWQAGPSIGPRYLAPLLPILALPCAMGFQRIPKVAFLLGAYSVTITTLATLVNAAPSVDIYHPLTELHIPALLRGEVSPNLGTVIGLSPTASILLFYAILLVGIVCVWRNVSRLDAVMSDNSPPRQL